MNRSQHSFLPAHELRVLDSFLENGFHHLSRGIINDFCNNQPRNLHSRWSAKIGIMKSRSSTSTKKCF